MRQLRGDLPLSSDYGSTKGIRLQPGLAAPQAEAIVDYPGLIVDYLQ